MKELPENQISDENTEQHATTQVAVEENIQNQENNAQDANLNQPPNPVPNQPQQNILPNPDFNQMPPVQVPNAGNWGLPNPIQNQNPQGQNVNPLQNPVPHQNQPNIFHFDQIQPQNFGFGALHQNPQNQPQNPVIHQPNFFQFNVNQAPLQPFVFGALLNQNQNQNQNANQPQPFLQAQGANVAPNVNILFNQNFNQPQNLQHQNINPFSFEDWMNAIQNMRFIENNDIVKKPDQIPNLIKNKELREKLKNEFILIEVDKEITKIKALNYIFKKNWALEACVNAITINVAADNQAITLEELEDFLLDIDLWNNATFFFFKALLSRPELCSHIFDIPFIKQHFSTPDVILPNQLLVVICCLIEATHFLDSLENENSGLKVQMLCRLIKEKAYIKLDVKMSFLRVINTPWFVDNFPASSINWEEHIDLISLLIKCATTMQPDNLLSKLLANKEFVKSVKLFGSKGLGFRESYNPIFLNWLFLSEDQEIEIEQEKNSILQSLFLNKGGILKKLDLLCLFSPMPSSRLAFFIGYFSCDQEKLFKGIILLIQKKPIILPNVQLQAVIDQTFLKHFDLHKHFIPNTPKFSHLNALIKDIETNRNIFSQENLTRNKRESFFSNIAIFYQVYSLLFNSNYHFSSCDPKNKIWIFLPDKNTVEIKDDTSVRYSEYFNFWPNRTQTRTALTHGIMLEALQISPALKRNQVKQVYIEFPYFDAGTDKTKSNVFFKQLLSLNNQKCLKKLTLKLHFFQLTQTDLENLIIFLKGSSLESVSISVGAHWPLGSPIDLNLLALQVLPHPTLQEIKLIFSYKNEPNSLCIQTYLAKPLKNKDYEINIDVGQGRAIYTLNNYQLGNSYQNTASTLFQTLGIWPNMPMNPVPPSNVIEDILREHWEACEENFTQKKKIETLSFLSKTTTIPYFLHKECQFWLDLLYSDAQIPFMNLEKLNLYGCVQRAFIYSLGSTYFQGTPFSFDEELYKTTVERFNNPKQTNRFLLSIPSSAKNLLIAQPELCIWRQADQENTLGQIQKLIGNKAWELFLASYPYVFNEDAHKCLPNLFLFLNQDSKSAFYEGILQYFINDQASFSFILSILSLEMEFAPYLSVEECTLYMELFGKLHEEKLSSSNEGELSIEQLDTFNYYKMAVFDLFNENKLALLVDLLLHILLLNRYELVKNGVGILIVEIEETLKEALYEKILTAMTNPPFPELSIKKTDLNPGFWQLTSQGKKGGICKPRKPVNNTPPSIDLDIGFDDPQQHIESIMNAQLQLEKFNSPNIFSHILDDGVSVAKLIPLKISDLSTGLDSSQHIENEMNTYLQCKKIDNFDVFSSIPGEEVRDFFSKGKSFSDLCNVLNTFSANLLRHYKKLGGCVMNLKTASNAFESIEKEKSKKSENEGRKLKF